MAGITQAGSTPDVGGAAPAVFQAALGRTYDQLPPALQNLHSVHRPRIWRGRVQVTRGPNALAGLIASVFRFPPPSLDEDIEVTMTPTPTSEIWVRRIAGRAWRSNLRADRRVQGRIWERFGLFTFAVDLALTDQTLQFPVTAGRFLGIPVPRQFLPISNSAERAGSDAARATFDVALSLPLIGDVVQYTGWLQDGET